MGRVEIYIFRINVRFRILLQSSPLLGHRHGGRYGHVRRLLYLYRLLRVGHRQRHMRPDARADELTIPSTDELAISEFSSTDEFAISSTDELAISRTDDKPSTDDEPSTNAAWELLHRNHGTADRRHEVVQRLGHRDDELRGHLRVGYFGGR